QLLRDRRQRVGGALLSTCKAVARPVGSQGASEARGDACLLRGLFLQRADPLAGVGGTGPGLVRAHRRRLLRLSLPGDDPAAAMERAGAAELSARPAPVGDGARGGAGAAGRSWRGG